MSIQPKTVVVGRLRPSMKITMLVVGRLRPSQEMGLKIATCRPATAGKNLQNEQSIHVDVQHEIL